MPQKIDLSTAQSIVLDANMQLNQFFWEERVSPRSRNLMVVTSAFREIAPSMRQDADFMLSNPEVYEESGRCWLRPHACDVDKLLSFLNAVLRIPTHSQALLLTYNECIERLIPDPWIPSWVDTEHSDAQAITTLAGLDITSATSAAISCNLPSEIPTILTFARWYLQRKENLYLLCDRLSRIVICHEGDLHICSLSKEYIDQIITIATNQSLYFAPFDSQQCS